MHNITALDDSIIISCAHITHLKSRKMIANIDVGKKEEHSQIQLGFHSQLLKIMISNENLSLKARILIKYLVFSIYLVHHWSYS